MKTYKCKRSVGCTQFLSIDAALIHLRTKDSHYKEIHVGTVLIETGEAGNVPHLGLYRSVFQVQGKERYVSLTNNDISSFLTPYGEVFANDFETSIESKYKY